MKRKFQHLVILTCGLLLTHAPAGRTAEPLTFAGLMRVPLIAAPALDGHWINAPEWQSAGQITGWADRVLGAANRDGTQVAVGHAAGILYVRFTCPIPEKFRLNKVVYAGNPLKMTVKDKDNDIFQDDFVGVYLTPPGSRDLYFLGVNGAGIIRDSHNGEVSWNGQWQNQQIIDDFVWTTGFSIPLNQFGGAVTEDQAWGVNFAHGARNMELLESIWAYQPAELQPMAEMRLSSRSIAVMLAGFGNLADGSLAFKGQIRNLSKEPFAGTLEVAVQDFAAAGKAVFGPEKTGLALKPNEKKDFAANFNAAGPLCGKTLITVKDAQGTVWLDYGLTFVFAREISLETRWIPTPAILQVVLDLGSVASFNKVTDGMVKITSLETQKEMLTQVLPAFQSSFSISDIDCGRLPVGRYGVEVELKLGAAIAGLKDVFVKEPDPEWLGNTIGMSDKVPAPWTALKTDGGGRGWLRAPQPLTVSCWGRQYTFGAAGFPRQIKVLGEDILAGPTRILVTRGGRTEVLLAGACQTTEKKETRVTFKSVAKAGGLEIAAETWIEFDGFVWTTFRVQADTTAEIDGLSIEIPFKKEYATLWRHPALAVGKLTDKMGAPPRQPYASEPLNALRLGDEDHGIQFFFESRRSWNSAPGKGQELIPGDKEFVLRYNLIGQPTKLVQAAEFALGYIALPCRPRSNLFRKIDVAGMWSGRSGLSRERLDQAGWLFQISNLFEGNWSGRECCNYFNFRNEAAFDKDVLQKFKKKFVDAWETNRDTLCMYYQGCVNDANTTEYRTYRFEWKTTPGSAPYIPPDPKTQGKSIMAPVCHQSRSYVDFQVWYMDKALRYLSDNGTRPIHGYQDCGGNNPCANNLHGCPAEGHIPIRANREYAKRVYLTIKTINPLNQMYVHAGSSTAMNWDGFYDVSFEGEQFTSGYLADIVLDPSLPKNWTRIIDLDRFRAQFQPYAWGGDRFLLWQFWAWMGTESDDARGAQGHLWGLCFSHDVPVWACGVPLCLPRALAELGWDEQVEFIPYWRKKTGIEVKAPVSPVVASGWQRGKGSLLVLVFNDSDQTADSRLTLDFARFGFTPGAIKCRDYGGAGLGYPDALFNARFTEKKAVAGGFAFKSEFVDPQTLPVQDTVVKSGADVTVEVKQRSFKLLRFWQE